MSSGQENPDDKASRLGLEVRRPTATQLFVDIDSAEQMHRFHTGLEELLCIEGEKSATYVQTASPSGLPHHWHIVVDLIDHDDLDPNERIAYQILLGSDPKRELLALRKIRLGYADDAVVFFERPA